MQVSIETLSGLGRKLNIHVPIGDIDSKYQTRIKEMAKEANIKGFRPGKVPGREIERRYGPSVRQEIVGHVIQESLYQAIEQEKLRLAGSPSITKVNAEPNQDLSFVAEFEILPEITPIDLAGKTIESVTSSVDGKAIETAIENLRKQRVNWKPVERAAKKEDRVKIDFVGTKNGEAIDNGEAQGSFLVLGLGQMPENFEKALEGTKADDKLDIKVDYPKEHQNKSIAGETLVFNVTVHEVAESELPEVNEAFLKELGLDPATMEEFQKEIKVALGRELDQILKNINKQTVVDTLLQVNKSIEMPNSLLKTELDNLLKSSGVQKLEDLPKDKQKEVKESAEKRVLLGLIIGEFANKYKVNADQAAVRQMVEQMAVAQPNPQEVVEWYYKDKNRLAGIEWLVLEDQVVEKLLETATLKEKGLSYEEVVEKARQ